MADTLPQRIEVAGGADRELDAAIARAAGWTQNCSPVWGIGAPHWSLNGRSNREVIGYWEGHDHGTLPFFTASIDAALTLVKVGGEDGFCLRVLTSDDGVSHIAEVWRGDGEWASRAKTPALALCAAALRAKDHPNG